MEHCGDSSDDSDYEPAPIGMTLDAKSPPPVPPPRGVTFPRRIHSHGSKEFSSAESKSRQHLSLSHTVRKSISADFTFVPPAGPVPLSQFITRYSALLPCQVKLCEGSTSASLPKPLPPDGIIDLHFIKHAKVFIMKKSSSGEEISAPLNTAVKFSVLYDPNSDFDEAMCGYQFGTAGEVISMKQLPVVVKATKVYKGNTSLSSVEAGEVLRVTGVKTSFRSKQLRVQNLQRESKHLSEKCSGAFTTTPKDIALPLSSFLDLDIGLPQRVVVCADGNRDVHVPAILMLEKMAGKTCLVASYPDWQHKELCHFEVSSDIDVQVEAVTMDLRARDDVESRTRALFCNFSSSIPMKTVNDQSTEAQKLSSVFHSQLLSGREQQGVQLVRPPTLCIDSNQFQDPRTFPKLVAGPEVQVVCPTPLTGPTPLTEEPQAEVTADLCSPTSEMDLDDLYVRMAKLDEIPESFSDEEDLEPTCSQSLESELVKTGKNRVCSVGSNESEAKVTSTSNNVGDLSVDLKSLASRVDRLSTCVEQQNSIFDEIKRLRSTLLAVQKDVQCLKQSLQSAATPPHREAVPDPQEEEHDQNRRFLAAMDCTQVISISTVSTINIVWF